MDGVGALSGGEGVRDGPSAKNILLFNDVPTPTDSRPHDNSIPFESDNFPIDIECSFEIR
jgi:hypothetical protein